ncbi:MAG: ATP synthase F0 subunit B [Holophagales bacterium]|jgi:F-type H+-transporting ATPase subunit b|nr:ATP synthase F0 subunit B [Holophagales bacterium]
MQKLFKSFLFLAATIALAAQHSESLAAQEHGVAQTKITSSQEAGDAAKNDVHATATAEAQESSGHHGEPVFLFGKRLGPTAQFMLKLLNVLIFCGLLIWMLKGVLGAAFKARANEIETKLAQSEKDRAEGEAQIRELEAKMAGLQAELGGIMAKAEADAEAEKQHILEAARQEAEQILATAHSEIEYQRRLAEKELRGLIANLAVEGAEKRIQQQMQGENVARVMDLAIEQIGGAD